ncbi:MAG: AAA family ATPase [Bacillota bacterium]
MKPSAPFERLLPPEVEIDLYSLNPHWQGKPGPLVPEFKRWLFPRLLRSLLAGITPAVVLRGPRRVGKTVLLRQLIEELLARGVDPRWPTSRRAAWNRKWTSFSPSDQTHPGRGKI